MGISEATGAETATINLGGTDYTLSPLTLKEYGDVENDMKRSRRKELLEETDGLGMEPIDLARYIKEELAKISIFTSIGTMEGIALALYHSIKVIHTEATLDGIKKVLNVENITEASDKLSSLMTTPTKKDHGQAEKK